MFEDINVTGAVVQIALTLFGLFATLAAAQITRRTGLEIEQTHIDRIKVGVSNVVTAALADGKTDLAELTRLSTAYITSQLPDAMAYVKPSQVAIQTIAKVELEAALQGMGVMSTETP